MANTSGHTKKVTVNALMFLAYCIGNIIAPQFFITSQSPGYATGYNAILACMVIAIASLVVYAVGLMLENKRRDVVEGEQQGELQNQDALEDCTDREKKGFRYVY
jgi:ACS family allantoate permease-like MFS transporter